MEMEIKYGTETAQCDNGVRVYRGQFPAVPLQGATLKEHYVGVCQHKPIMSQLQLVAKFGARELTPGETGAGIVRISSA